MDLSLVSLDGIEASYAHPRTNTSKFDLSLEIIPNDNEFKLSFEYCTKLFDEDFIVKFAKRYENILNEILIQPDILISNISILDEEEKHRILYEFNNTKSDYPKDQTIIQLFEEQVNKTPDNIAVVFENKKLTYRELNEKANALACDLISYNVQYKDVVGVFLPRSIEFVISIFAILKCGAIYMPIYANYPSDRINYMLENSNTKLVITNSSLSSKVNSTSNIKIDNFEDIDFVPDNPKTTSSYNDIAYIIYTSGSTGRPKGVQITNRCLNNFIHSFDSYFDGISSSDNFLSSTNISFDVSIFELFLPLISGARLVLYHEELIKDILDYCDYIIKHEITGLYIPPNILNEVYYILKNKPNVKINKLLVGVEAIRKETLDKYFLLNSKMHIVNGYGPTETTICCSALPYTRELELDTDIVPIGKPLFNNHIYILDDNKKLLPIGSSGELYITGDGVGAGYINNDVETAKNYIINTFDSSSKKMYKTGDIGKWNDDGTISLSGRKDNQVKISGYRIELDEIDSVIMSYPNIEKSITIVSNIGNKDYLVSYFTSSKDIATEDLLSFLKKKLTFYMIPSKLVKLDNFPITANGKIDKKALPKIDLTVHKNSYIAPSNKLELQIAKIFESLLSTSPIGIDDNFFEIGGDSLNAINLQVELLKLNLKITYSDIFTYPTIRELARKISSNDTLTSNVNNMDNFSEFDKILNNTTTIPSNFTANKLGNILLTGSTGFLGSHILDSLLKQETGKIYCIVRPGNDMSLEDKFIKKLHYYFGNKYDKYIGNRIILVNADMSKYNLNLSDEKINEIFNNINCIVNCAAKVSHFGNYSEFKKINVDSVENLLKISLKFNKRFYQISTLSVAGSSFIEQSYKETSIVNDVIFRENNFYINQSLDNVYVRSKFEAEKLVFEYILRGVDAYILRVGNLMNRYSDGKFQQNIEQNAYISRLASFANIGCIPDYLLNSYLEFTPIDICANGVIKLIQYSNRKNRVFHLYNHNHVDISDFIKFLKKYGTFDVVSNEEFTYKINDMIKQDNSSKMLAGILRDFDVNQKLVYTSKVKIKSEFTINYLQKIGFIWPKISEEYLTKFFDYFRLIGYINFKEE